MPKNFDLKREVHCSVSITVQDAQQSLLLEMKDRDLGKAIVVRRVAPGSRAQQVRTSVEHVRGQLV